MLLFIFVDWRVNSLSEIIISRFSLVLRCFWHVFWFFWRLECLCKCEHSEYCRRSGHIYTFGGLCRVFASAFVFRIFVHCCPFVFLSFWTFIISDTSFLVLLFFIVGDCASDRFRFPCDRVFSRMLSILYIVPFCFHYFALFFMVLAFFDSRTIWVYLYP